MEVNKKILGEILNIKLKLLCVLKNISKAEIIRNVNIACGCNIDLHRGAYRIYEWNPISFRRGKATKLPLLPERAKVFSQIFSIREEYFINPRINPERYSEFRIYDE